jgi:uncharacterized tellurite resistance protein B-like protein
MIEMFKSIVKTIKAKPAAAGNEKTDSELELQIATCALLLEMAHADDEYTPEEEAHIAGLMQQRFGLSPEAFEQIHGLADQRRREQIDLWGFTKTLKTHFSHAQKMQVMEMLWSVIYADDTLADYEDHLVHTLAKLLDIDHRDMIAAKVKILNESKG